MPLLLAGIARMKNEADIIEPFVRHHVRLLDHLIIVDNGSRDASLTILQRLLAEGLPITILTDDVIAYHQSEVMTYYSRLAFARLNCDRLFLLDADEFLKVESRKELEERLASIPNETHGLIPWVSYTPSAGDDLAEINPVARIVHRHAQPSDSYKLVLAKSFTQLTDVVIAQGNHDLNSSDPACRCALVPDLYLAHFPVRTIRQLQNKAVAGWCAYIARGGEDHGIGNQWKMLYEKLRRDTAWTNDDLFKIGILYPDLARERQPVIIREPFPYRGVLLYTEVQSLEPLHVAIDFARDVSRLYAAACRVANQPGPTLARVQDAVDLLRLKAAAQEEEWQTWRVQMNQVLAQTDELRKGKLIRLAVNLTMAWRRLRNRLRVATSATRQDRESPPA